MDRKLVNRFFIVAALLILLVSSISAGQRFLGDIYGERVALSLDFWGRKRISPDLQMLDQHLDFISQARSYSPSSARYLELEARLRLMRLLEIPLANVPGQLEEILSLHKTAL